MIAISTAFKTASLAVSMNNKQSFRELDANCKHSENVLKTLDSMLDEMGEDIKDNDTFAVVVGPGSFTGLRIGLALVKGLCAGKTNKVIPISSFDLIAYCYVKNSTPKTNFTVAINALSGLVFVCKFDKSGKALSEGKLMEREGLDARDADIVSLEGDNLPYKQVTTRAEELLELVLILEKEGKTADLASLSPIYLRKSQAEAELDKKTLKK